MKHRYLALSALSVLSAVTVAAQECLIEAPAPVYPIPTKQQVEWQKRETTAFIHFGLNTFNDREWGYGDSDPATFAPSRLDCEQWVRTLKAAGMQGVIITAKHHDGFCMWPTQLTDYCISAAPYKDGNGDVVGELEGACRKYGVEFGVYLSPWDRHQASYGTAEYVELYHNQLAELLSNYGDLFEVWFDGANGGDGWYGGANETRKIDHATYYDFPTMRAMVEERHPDAIIFGDGGPGCRWVGNEKGYAGETDWAFIGNTDTLPRLERKRLLTTGDINGDQWKAAECDVSIRPGWFWHEAENDKVKTAAQLTDLYYRSVGRNALLLLNFPVNAEGLISATDSLNAALMYENIKAELAVDLLKGKTPIATNRRGIGYAPELTTDGDYDTYWATADSVTSADITFTFDEATKINRLMLQEYIPLGQRVKSFSLYYTDGDGTQHAVPVDEMTTTIGYKRLLRFPTIEATALTIRFDEARGPLCINNIGAFFADTEIARSPIDDSTGALPQSFPLRLLATGAEAAKAIDGDSKTTAFIDANTLVLDLGESRTVRSLFYLPDQAPLPRGIISHYSIKVGDDDDATAAVEVAAGEFSNINNNPILQTVTFPPTRARYVFFTATTVVDDASTIGVAEVGVK